MNGALIIDKPAGLTSHDVVARVRKIIGERRVGHTGTLDPFATGLLVLLVGHATRLLPHLDGEPKVYDATIVFGSETDTDDLTGKYASCPEKQGHEGRMRRFLIAIAAVDSRPELLVALLAAPLVPPLVRTVSSRTDGPSLNMALARCGALLALFSVFLSAGLLLS